MPSAPSPSFRAARAGWEAPVLASVRDASTRQAPAAFAGVRLGCLRFSRRHRDGGSGARAGGFRRVDLGSWSAAPGWALPQLSGVVHMAPAYWKCAFLTLAARQVRSLNSFHSTGKMGPWFKCAARHVPCPECAGISTFLLTVRTVVRKTVGTGKGDSGTSTTFAEDEKIRICRSRDRTQETQEN